MLDNSGGGASGDGALEGNSFNFNGKSEQKILGGGVKQNKQISLSEFKSSSNNNFTPSRSITENIVSTNALMSDEQVPG